MIRITPEQLDDWLADCDKGPPFHIHEANLRQLILDFKDCKGLLLGIHDQIELSIDRTKKGDGVSWSECCRTHRAKIELLFPASYFERQTKHHHTKKIKKKEA